MDDAQDQKTEAVGFPKTSLLAAMEAIDLAASSLRLSAFENDLVSRLERKEPSCGRLIITRGRPNGCLFTLQIANVPL